MTLIKEQFNIFNRNEPKQFIQFVKDFSATIKELYDYEKKENVDLEINLEVYDLMVELGMINSINEIDLIENLLGDYYDEFIAVLKCIINNGGNLEEPFLKNFISSYRQEACEKYLVDKTSPTVVDFFCGAGGMSLGFKQVGFKILFANDVEKVCTNTYSFNHPEIPKNRIVTNDIKSIIDDIESYVTDEVDVILGGPPCQGFSMANRQRLIDDPRNILYKYYVKGVEKLKPKFFVMENVKGMLNVAEQVKEDFHSLVDVDYDVSYKVFNAKDFGVPQNRERLIYIGIRKDVSELVNKDADVIIGELVASLETEKQYVLNDAIKDLRPLEALQIKNATELDTELSGRKIEKSREIHESEFVKLINNGIQNNLILNHKARYNNARDIEIFDRMLPGDKSDSERIKDIMPYASRSHVFKDKYYKLKPNAVCKTITAHMKFDCNMYIHPFQARGLTPREAARVQSYPDYYYFLGPYTKTYMQIGNSVPPLMSKKIAGYIKKYLK